MNKNECKAQEINILDNMSLEDIEILDSCATLKKFKIGQDIIKEGDIGYSMFHIQSGNVEIVKKTNDYKLSMQLATLGPGELFGEMALLDESPRSASVRSLDFCTLFEININQLSCNKKASKILNIMLKNLARALSERLRFANNVSMQAHVVGHVDRLTGLANRRYFDEFLATSWADGLKKGVAVGLILIDIDHFKPYNDNYGHQAGDDCLVEFGKIMLQLVADTPAMAARYGGEEFAIILPETDKEHIIGIAELTRQTIMDNKIKHEFSSLSCKVLTASIGAIAYIPSDNHQAKELIQCADEGLYKSKESGRNSVTYCSLKK